VKSEDRDRNAGASLIPGIYHYCDQWCDYCPATGRCLARRLAAPHEERWNGSSVDSVQEAIAFAREVAEASGGRSPLDDLITSNAFLDVPAVDDPLARLGEEYAWEATRFLRFARWLPPRVWPSPQPTPLDVVGWYRMLIAIKIHRAFSSRALGAGGESVFRSDADGSAKVALIGMERSRAAFRQMARPDRQIQARGLAERLARLQAMLEERFPDARAFARPGLDAPVV
jgi:hypothetical protein